MKELHDDSLEAVTGGALTDNAYLVMQASVQTAKQQGMTKADAISTLKAEWANKNSLLMMVTTDFSQADLDACLDYIEKNW